MAVDEDDVAVVDDFREDDDGGVSGTVLEGDAMFNMASSFSFVNKRDCDERRAAQTVKEHTTKKHEKAMCDTHTRCGKKMMHAVSEKKNQHLKFCDKKNYRKNHQKK